MLEYGLLNCGETLERARENQVNIRHGIKLIKPSICLAGRREKDGCKTGFQNKKAGKENTFK